MFTVLWDNDGVLVDTEGLYFRATKSVLETVGIHLIRNQFIDITLRQGERKGNEHHGHDCSEKWTVHGVPPGGFGLSEYRG